jgi:hypothetical protein
MAEEFSFNLQQAVIATWIGTNNWGTAIELEACEIFGLKLETLNGRLMGSGGVADAAAVLIAGQVQLKIGYKKGEVYEIMTGSAQTESTDRRSQIFRAGQQMPWFGISGRILHTAGGGDLHLFVAKLKLMEGLEVKLQVGQYNISEINALALDSGSTFGIGRLIDHDTAAVCAIPPL